MANIGQQNITPGLTKIIITKGYHDGTGEVPGDVDLKAENIKSGVTLFGVSGKTEVVDTSTGDALADEIFLGKIAWVNGLKVTGTITTQTLSDSSDTITAGTYAGTTLSAVDADLLSENIKSGITLFGVPGKVEVVDTSTGDAIAGELLSGKIAWVDGVEVTGTIATETLNASTTTVAAGNYAGTTLSAVDGDLVSDNIKSGITLFGVTGKTEVVDTTTGDAVAGEIMSGKIAFVDGVKLTGTLATQTLNASTTTVTAGNYVGTTLTAVDSDLDSDNIKSGVTIFGLSGKTEVVDTTSGDAVAGEILTGKVAWVDGTEITGTVTAGSDVAGDNGSLIITIPDGIYSSSKTATARDLNLIEDNICNGITIFGITGNKTCS